jgi:hypothetical protein
LTEAGFEIGSTKPASYQTTLEVGEHQPDFYGTDPAQIIMIPRPQLAFQVNVYDIDTMYLLIAEPVIIDSVQHISVTSEISSLPERL